MVLLSSLYIHLNIINLKTNIMNLKEMKLKNKLDDLNKQLWFHTEMGNFGMVDSLKDRIKLFKHKNNI